jgi:hypothetical protein
MASSIPGLPPSRSAETSASRQDRSGPPAAPKWPIAALLHLQRQNLPLVLEKSRPITRTTPVGLFPGRPPHGRESNVRDGSTWRGPSRTPFGRRRGHRSSESTDLWRLDNSVAPSSRRQPVRRPTTSRNPSRRASASRSTRQTDPCPIDVPKYIPTLSPHKSSDYFLHSEIAFVTRRAPNGSPRKTVSD